MDCLHIVSYQPFGQDVQADQSEFDLCSLNFMVKLCENWGNLVCAMDTSLVQHAFIDGFDVTTLLMTFIHKNPFGNKKKTRLALTFRLVLPYS